MNQLIASDCLSLDVIRVLREDRPSEIPEQMVFAVFTDFGESEVFCGLVTAQEIVQQPDWNFGDLIKSNVIHSVPSEASAYEALAVMDREDLSALSVLDRLGALAGVVTRHSIIQALPQHERVLLDELERLRHEVEELDRTSKVRIRRLVQLDKTSRDLVAVIGLTSIETNLLQVAIEALTTLLRVRYGAIGILEETDESGKALKHFNHVGISPELVQSIGRLPEGRGLLGVVIKENVILRLEDMSKDPRSVGFPPHHPPMKSLLAVPIAGDHHVYGRIYLSEKLNGLPFNEDDAMLVQNFSRWLAAKALNKSVSPG